MCSPTPWPRNLELRGLSRAVKALSFEFTIIQRNVALACIERCTALGYTRFNAALGESQTFVNPDWVGGEQIARWLTGLFSKRTHVYQTAAARQLRLLFWPLLALGAGLSVVPAVGMSTRPASSFEWLLTAGFVLFTLVLSGPALVLHVRYWLLNRETTLVFSWRYF